MPDRSIVEVVFDSVIAINSSLDSGELQLLKPNIDYIEINLNNPEFVKQLTNEQFNELNTALDRAKAALNV